MKSEASRGFVERRDVEKHGVGGQGVSTFRLSTPRLWAMCLSTLLVGVGCGEGVKPTATTTVADSADQVLITMTHYVTTEGIRRARVQADTAYFFNAAQVAELRVVQVTFYDAQGAETSTLTANEGTFHWRSQDMEGRGNVVAIRKSDGGTLRTEAMRYNQAQNKVTSDLPFTFDSPDQHLKGVGFTADPDFRSVAAKQITGTGGQLVLPSH